MHSGLAQMNCTHCNASIERQARFCPQCGTSVKASLEVNEADSASTAASNQKQPEKTISRHYLNKKERLRKIRQKEYEFRPTKHSTSQPLKKATTSDLTQSKQNMSERPVIIDAKLLELEHYKSVPAAAANKTQEVEPAPEPASTSEKKQYDQSSESYETIEVPEIPAEAKPKHTITELPTVSIDLDNLTNKNKENAKSIPDKQAPQTVQPPIFLTTEELLTQPVPLESIAHPELMEPDEHATIISQQNLSPLEQAAPLLYHKLNTTTKESQMLPAVINTPSQARKARRKRSAGGCVFGCLTFLVVLLIIIGASWIFAVRPYLHNIAQTQLDNALNTGVNQLPAQISRQIPSGVAVPVNENTINNLIVLNLSPSNPVKNPSTRITDQDVSLSFDLYNYPNSVTLVPANVNGQIVATNVHVNGIFGLIMSPDEMTSILNQHFAAAQTKIGRTITNVQLKNQAIEITFG